MPPFAPSRPPFTVIDPSSDDHRREVSERSLVDAGIRLPLFHQAGWTLARRKVESLYVALHPDGASPGGAFAVDVSRSRALPFFRLLRVERFGEALAQELWEPAATALAHLAYRPRVLRLSVELFSRDASRRAQLADLLSRVGFKRASTVRNWPTTLALDLSPGEDELLASFSKGTRQGIRSLPKLPVQVRTIDDARYAGRLDALLRETLARTRGDRETRWHWPGVIAVSSRCPEASRLVGLFRTDRAGPDALVAFAWGLWNGQSVSYFCAASSRPSDLRVAVGAPLLWDLMLWAKRNGATWFDLGGITEGTASSGDPIGGISDFKRSFTKTTAEVAEDWLLEPGWFRTRVAGALSSTATSVIQVLQEIGCVGSFFG